MALTEIQVAELRELFQSTTAMVAFLREVINGEHQELCKEAKARNLKTFGELYKLYLSKKKEGGKNG